MADKQRDKHRERQSDKRRENDNERLLRCISAREQRMRKTQREGHRDVWFGLGMFGLVGWSVAIPTLAGIALGVWIDSKTQGQYSWTLMLLALGVIVGCLNAWFWIKRESRDD